MRRAARHVVLQQAANELDYDAAPVAPCLWALLICDVLAVIVVPHEAKVAA